MKVFVSYNNRDSEIATRVADGLIALQPKLDPYFAPRSNIGGAYWLPRLGEELERSDVFLLLIGNRIGIWQEIEYYEAFRLNRTKQKPMIVPVLLGEERPGLHFLNQFHRLRMDQQTFDGFCQVIRS